MSLGGWKALRAASSAAAWAPVAGMEWPSTGRRRGTVGGLGQQHRAGRAPMLLLHPLAMCSTDQASAFDIMHMVGPRGPWATAMWAPLPGSICPVPGRAGGGIGTWGRELYMCAVLSVHNRPAVTTSNRPRTWLSCDRVAYVLGGSRMYPRASPGCAGPSRGLPQGLVDAHGAWGSEPGGSDLPQVPTITPALATGLLNASGDAQGGRSTGADKRVGNARETQLWSRRWPHEAIRQRDPQSMRHMAGPSTWETHPSTRSNEWLGQASSHARLGHHSCCWARQPRNRHLPCARWTTSARPWVRNGRVWPRALTGAGLHWFSAPPLRDEPACDFANGREHPRGGLRSVRERSRCNKGGWGRGRGRVGSNLL